MIEASNRAEVVIGQRVDDDHDRPENLRPPRQGVKERRRHKVAVAVETRERHVLPGVARCIKAVLDQLRVRLVIMRGDVMEAVSQLVFVIFNR